MLVMHLCPKNKSVPITGYVILENHLFCFLNVHDGDNIKIIKYKQRS